MNILITGGTKGIGRATALRFASEGNQLFLNYFHDHQAAKNTADECESKGANVFLLQYNAGEPVHIKEMANQVQDEVDQMDLVVHCAAGVTQGNTLEISPEDWRKAVSVSSLSLIDVVRELRPILKNGSSIIALSSRGATNYVPNYAALGTTKAFTEGIVRYLAYELAPDGISVNIVSAGPLNTEAFRSMFPNNADERLQAAANANPSGRGLEFEDVTNTIAFLASADAKMIKGRNIFIDGGLYL
jgi:enoyl-[acyl-carrier protein] reductase III